MESQWLEILGRVAQGALRQIPPQQFGQEALAQLLPTLGLEVEAVNLLADQEFLLLTHYGLSQPFALAAARNPRDHPYLGRVLAERKPILGREFRDPFTQEKKIQLAIYVPLLVGGQELGVLALGTRKP
ncbi:MAG: GAF domain-containing protein [Candidatus Bipolaricaulaceae bacterium]